MKVNHLNKRKINVLGDEYTILVKEKLDEEYYNCEAYCDCVAHEIVIREQSLKDSNRVLRHEIVHAFLFSSGLGFNFEHKDIGHEETIVDWFAIQYPKMNKLFHELGIEK